MEKVVSAMSYEGREGAEGVGCKYDFGAASCSLSGVCLALTEQAVDIIL